MLFLGILSLKVAILDMTAHLIIDCHYQYEQKIDQEGWSLNCPSAFWLDFCFWKLLFETAFPTKLVQQLFQLILQEFQSSSELETLSFDIRQMKLQVLPPF